MATPPLGNRSGNAAALRVNLHVPSVVLKDKVYTEAFTAGVTNLPEESVSLTGKTGFSDEQLTAYQPTLVPFQPACLPHSHYVTDSS